MWQVEKSWRGVMWLPHSPQPPQSPSSMLSFPACLPHTSLCGDVILLSSLLLSSSPKVCYGLWRRHTRTHCTTTPYRVSSGSTIGWGNGLLTPQPPLRCWRRAVSSGWIHRPDRIVWVTLWSSQMAKPLSWFMITIQLISGPHNALSASCPPARPPLPSKSALISLCHPLCYCVWRLLRSGLFYFFISLIFLNSRIHFICPQAQRVMAGDGVAN